MSTQSSFQRGSSMNEMFSSLLNTDTSSLTPGYTGPLRSLSSDGHRQSTRPVSEILKPDNFKSAESKYYLYVKFDKTNQTFFFDSSSIG